MLANVYWHALSVTQAHLALGTGAIRRYAPGFPPIVAYADCERPDFAALRPYVAPAHVPQMTALAALARPGPYADRPLDIGEWWGVFDGDRLVAMAGERAHAGTLREISGVCTVPDMRGRGLARRLTGQVVRSQLARGLTPFLHVASANTRARELYERMGFVVEREEPMRVISVIA